MGLLVTAMCQPCRHQSDGVISHILSPRAHPLAQDSVLPQPSHTISSQRFLRKENAVCTVLETVQPQSSAHKLARLEAVTCTVRFSGTEELPTSGKIAEALKRCIYLVPFTLRAPGLQKDIGRSTMLSQKGGSSRFSALLKADRRWGPFSTIQFFLCVSPAGDRAPARLQCESRKQQRYGYSKIFFLLPKILVIKSQEEFLHQQIWAHMSLHRKENALHCNNDSSVAVKLAKGFIELCFKGLLRHIGDTLAVGEGNHYWLETSN